LRYISPYGRELAAFFTNFRGVLGSVDEVGINYLRLAPIMGNTAVLDGIPVYTGGLLHTDNPYPSPGGLQNPSEMQREFTRLEEDPR
jgi:phospholipid/cholesterol/gamma-HCH transport system substrate-binding protein